MMFVYVLCMWREEKKYRYKNLKINKQSGYTGTWVCDMCSKQYHFNVQTGFSNRDSGDKRSG